MSEHHGGSRRICVLSRLVSAGFAFAIFVLFPSEPAAGATKIYYSPADDGAVSASLPQALSIGAHSVPLYMNGGLLASPSDACSLGTGDEICGIDVRLLTRGSVTFGGFIPAGNFSFRLEATELRIAGGNFATGDLGPVKLGDITIHATGPGFVDLASATAVGADLQSEVISPGQIVAVPEPSFILGIAVGAALLAMLPKP